MCGIAGVVRKGSWHGNDEELVALMCNAVVHRGPDGGGVYSKNGVTLGHRRLSIIDLSQAARQPMVKGEISLTFNGEIYNYIELRTQLQSLGSWFDTDSDTEVLLEAYRQWGISCLEQLEGMWAFALHDAGSGRLFCSRDRFGEKPFLYRVSHEGFMFASEPCQFISTGLARQADAESVLSYLGAAQLATPESTFLAGVRNLPPASVLELDTNTLESSISRYYSPGRSSQLVDVSRHEFDTLFDEAFSASVKLRLRSDVPVGVLLSGGIDSSLIAATAAPQYHQNTGNRLVAVTALSTDPDNDERQYASAVASKCNLEWVPLIIDSTLTREAWREATAAAQQPLASSSLVLQMKVMQAAKALGIKVMLDGQGADETWMGYPRHLVNALRVTPWPTKIDFALSSSKNSGLGIKKWLRNYLYFRSAGIGAVRNTMRLVVAGVSADGMGRRRMYRELSAAGSSGVSTQVEEVHGEQLSALLRYADRNSMFASIEDRLPFLDSRLVDLAFSTPVAIKYQDGWSKAPLRRSLARVAPREVAWRRKKIGFAPSRNTFDPRGAEVWSAIRESSVLASVGASQVDPRRVHSSLAWRLYSVALWESVMGVQGGEATM